MEHCSYCHSDFYSLIPLLMSSIESHLSNKLKQVFFNPIHIFDTFSHSIALLYIFNILFFHLTSIFLIYSRTYLGIDHRWYCTCSRYDQQRVQSTIRLDQQRIRYLQCGTTLFKISHVQIRYENISWNK